MLGDQTAAAEAARVRRALIDRLTAPSQEADYDNGFDAYFGNQCADTEYPSSFLAFRAHRPLRRGRLPVRAVLVVVQQRGCADWPVNRDRYTGPWTARTSAPVLVVGNFFDGVTDHAGAVASDRLLRNSRLLSYAGWGHTAYGRSECTTEYIDAYLLDGSLPPVGTVCPANPNPFIPSVARTAAGTAPLVGLPPAWLFGR